MIHGADKVVQFYNEIQTTFAVLMGMALQFALGDHRGFKIAITIALSSVFVALFIVPAIVELMEINPAGKVAIAMYALSAIMSVEMLAIIIKVMPKALRIRTKRFLGVENDMQ